ncbi:hypothetical protein ZWY2020_009204 [Hordeum vulgare]|nr:hypothetical protein ZWY2020_009204 [Hordeum vulgare]
MAQVDGGNGSHAIDMDVGGDAKHTGPLAGHPLASPSNPSHAIDIDVGGDAKHTGPLAGHLLASPSNPSHVIDIDVGGAKHDGDHLATPSDPCHAVDVDAAPSEPSECGVCMEPLEWVAIGPCGHREVCSDCAVRMRAGSNSQLAGRRCCICREPCPTVLVTRSGGGGPRACPKLPPLGAFQGPVGGCYWYHSGSAAYFDDEQQFLAARRAYPKAEGDAREEDGASDEDGARGVGACSWLSSPLVTGLLFVALFLYMVEAHEGALRFWAND